MPKRCGYDCSYFLSPLQTCAIDGRDHIAVHADRTKLGFRSAVESRVEEPRGRMPEKLVEKFFVHSQLFRLQKHGNVIVVHYAHIKCVEKIPNIECFASYITHYIRVNCDRRV